jgi:hypothetical protein
MDTTQHYKYGLNLGALLQVVVKLFIADLHIKRTQTEKSANPENNPESTGWLPVFRRLPIFVSNS